MQKFPRPVKNPSQSEINEKSGATSGNARTAAYKHTGNKGGSKTLKGLRKK